MKKFLYSLMVSGLLMFGAGVTSQVMAQDDSVVDTLSIDDMDPILQAAEEESAEESSNTGMIAAIAIVAVVAGVVVFRFVGKKKK
ncbi:hypothetical protein EMN47_04535 [Prolixibacteraceae bacterium JC049]|nr:hypothetical protein [Prolixibacteraceae bacterium JC049]